MRAPNILCALDYVPDNYRIEDIYEYLFEVHPDTRASFVLDANMSVRGSMLQQCFEIILDYAEGGDLYALTIVGNYHNHDGYGVDPAIFLDFFGAIQAWISKICSEMIYGENREGEGIKGAHTQGLIMENLHAEWEIMISDFNRVLKDATE